jgi:hypothetical protein
MTSNHLASIDAAVLAQQICEQARQLSPENLADLAKYVEFLRFKSQGASSDRPAEAVLKLVDQWLAEDDGYDQEVWPIIRQDIEENRLSDRSRFLDQVPDP